MPECRYAAVLLRGSTSSLCADLFLASGVRDDGDEALLAVRTASLHAATATAGLALSPNSERCIGRGA